MDKAQVGIIIGYVRCT